MRTNRNITLLFTSQVISQAGDSMFQIGLLWIVLTLTGSRAITGIVAAAGFLPFLLFALPAGEIADRHSRKALMILSDGARAIFALTIPLLYFTHVLTIPLLAFITFLIATFSALFYPSRDALIPSLTPASTLPSVNTLIQTSWQLAVLLGPAMGAIILSLTGTINLFSADAATFLLSLLLLLRLRPAPKREEERDAFHRGMMAGVKYALRNPVLRIVIIVTALDNVILMGPAIVGIPIFVRDVLHLGAAHYAWVEAALAGGLFLGAPLTAVLASRVNLGKLLLWGVVLDGLTYLPLFFIRSYPLLLLAIFFHSIFIPFITVSRTTLVQAHTPNHLQGRIFSLILMCVVGGTALSSAMTGILADHVPMPTIYLFMALLAAATAAPGFLSKGLRVEAR